VAIGLAALEADHKPFSSRIKITWACRLLSARFRPGILSAKSTSRLKSPTFPRRRTTMAAHSRRSRSCRSSKTISMAEGTASEAPTAIAMSRISLLLL